KYRVSLMSAISHTLAINCPAFCERQIKTVNDGLTQGDTMSTAISAAPRSTGAPAATNRPMTREERRVIFASSLGTVFEWYDFYLYGSLAAIIAAHFFSGVNPTAGFIFALMAFAAGFAVRPFGALVFGRLGDMVGR